MSEDISLDDLIGLLGPTTAVAPESWYEGVSFQVQKPGEVLLVDLNPNSNYVHCEWRRGEVVIADVVFVGYESLSVERNKGQEHLFVRLPSNSYLVIQIAPAIKLSIRGELRGL